MSNTLSDTGTTARSHRDRSPADVKLDNMIRRTLRVSDPYNFKEIADALGKRYPQDRQVMQYEAEGLPFYKLRAVAPPRDTQTSSSAEMDQARRDIERDLNALTTNALLKDIEPELMGWASAIRSAVTEGVNAARFALDPRQRDKVFSARRLLGDYARVARFVGAMTPTLNLPYRRLSQSLDEAAGVMMVMMGEALANIGFSGGRFLLQAPLSDLQARRDAVMNALGNLVGTTQTAFGNNQWPRGLRAYRQFMDRLSNNAHNDIRVLLQENELARIMDELIDRAAGTTADGLRALGATAQITLERFRRLIALGQGVVQPASPPFSAFLEALRLFLESFNNSPSGYRLLAIARPAIVFYGLYGMSGPDEATRRLQAIVTHRGVLAEALDCYLGCNCCSEQARCQILLDKALYDVDRAIDLYSLGMTNFGEPEQRAAAYGFVLDEFLRSDGIGYECLNESDRQEDIEESCGKKRKVDGAMTRGDLRMSLERIRDQLWEPNLGTEFTAKKRNTMRDELCIQLEAEKQWHSLLQTMAPKCINVNGLIPQNDQYFLNPTFGLLNAAMENISGLGPAARPCTEGNGFPEDMSVSLSKIRENTESIQDSQGMVKIEPHSVDFGIVAFDETPKTRSLVIGNYGRTIVDKIKIQIHPSDAPFAIAKVSMNGTGLNVEACSELTLPPEIALAPDEKLFVSLVFDPDATPDADGFIETRTFTGELVVSAYGYTAWRPDKFDLNLPVSALSSIAGAAKLKGVLLGDDQPGEGMIQIYTHSSDLYTGKVIPKIIDKTTDEIIKSQLWVENGIVRFRIDPKELKDVSPDNLEIRISDPQKKEIVRRKLLFSPGKLTTDKIVLQKTSQFKFQQPALKTDLSVKKAKPVETDRWHVSGYLKDAKLSGQKGIRDFKVVLFDKDRKFHDQLGEPVKTGPGGYFEIKFDRAQFNDEFYQSGPDLFYQILNENDEIIYDSLKHKCPDEKHRNIQTVKDAGRNTDLGEIWINRK